ncbi:MAG: DUF6898 family protein [Methyloligellaceae bacterium]
MSKLDKTSQPTVKGEVLIEFTPVGNSVKVVAIDVTTGVEITLIGSTSVSQNDLKRLAVRKLERRIAEIVK